MELFPDNDHNHSLLSTSPPRETISEKSHSNSTSQAVSGGGDEASGGFLLTTKKIVTDDNDKKPEISGASPSEGTIEGMFITLVLMIMVFI